MRFIIALSLICYYLANDVSALIIACPETSSATTSSRLNVNLNGVLNYSGTLLSTFDGDFILLVSIGDVGSDLSAIGGTWSRSSNTLTFTGKSFYFLTMSMSTVIGFTCTYNCDSSDATFNSCTVTYKILSNNQTGTQTFALDLRAP
jgi:hypothetical protein